MPGAAVDSDVNADPKNAALQYQNFIAGFDSQREAAAHAVFGLGEAYRKMGRVDEARAQYSRILREFVDFPDISRQSQKLLAESQPGRAVSGLPGTGLGSPQSDEALAEERELVMEELKLLEGELETTKTRIQQGVEPTSSAFPIQREILQLKQRLVRTAQRRAEKAGRSVAAVEFGASEEMLLNAPTISLPTLCRSNSSKPRFQSVWSQSMCR
jgi:tetratricopeptide (TPR) repeat protein